MVKIFNQSYNLDYIVMSEKLKIIEEVFEWLTKEDQTLTNMRVRTINISSSEELRQEGNELSHSYRTNVKAKSATDWWLYHKEDYVQHTVIRQWDIIV